MGRRGQKNAWAAGLLLDSMRAPEDTLALGNQDWNLLLRMTRRARLLARLGAMLEEMGLLGRIPGAAREQMESELVIARHRENLARWEVDRLQRALGDVPIILLKGSAYLFAGLPSSRGRTFADVDILVPEGRLKEAEQRLQKGGWQPLKLDAYDQRYYRVWMHELPPMRHPQRHIEVDVHHRILPRTSRLHPDPSRLWEDAVAVDTGGLNALSPVDMVLHSVVHLFYDSELNGDLRDLVDIDDLLRHFGEGASFWEALVPRTRELDLSRPLFYALRHSQRFLGTPVPRTVQDAVSSAAPSAVVRSAMDALVPRGLLPDHPDYPRRTTGLARWLLYVRSHWLRMPPLLLTRHLFTKAFISSRRRGVSVRPV